MTCDNRDNMMKTLWHSVAYPVYGAVVGFAVGAMMAAREIIGRKP